MDQTADSTKLDIEQYHAHPAIGKSHLDAINQSPLHYWARFINPSRIPSIPTPAMQFGSAVHMAVLEPALFDLKYAQAPAIAKTTKAGKEAWAEAAAHGHILLKPDDWRAIAAIRTAISGHPAASAALSAAGRAEVSFFARDHSTKIPIKCRPDYLTESGWLIDLKTTKDASIRGFQRSIVNFRYHVQAAHYIDTVKAALGIAARGFCFIAVESEPPHAVQVFRCSQNLIEAGRVEAQRNLRQLHAAFDEFPTETPWPSYSLNPVEIDLPSWAAPSLPNLETF